MLRPILRPLFNSPIFLFRVVVCCPSVSSGFHNCDLFYLVGFIIESKVYFIKCRFFSSSIRFLIISFATRSYLVTLLFNKLFIDIFNSTIVISSHSSSLTIHFHVLTTICYQFLVCFVVSFHCLFELSISLSDFWSVLKYF